MGGGEGGLLAEEPAGGGDDIIGGRRADTEIGDVFSSEIEIQRVGFLVDAKGQSAFPRVERE